MNESNSQTNTPFVLHSGEVKNFDLDLRNSRANTIKSIKISTHKNSITLGFRFKLRPLNRSITIDEKNRRFECINNYLKDIKKNVEPCLEREIIDDIRSKAGIKTTKEARGEINQLIGEQNWDEVLRKTKAYYEYGYEEILTDKLAKGMIDTAKGFLQQGNFNEFHNRLYELEQLIPEKETLDDNSYEEILKQIKIERVHANFENKEYKLDDKENLKSLVSSFRELDNTGLKLPQGYQFLTPPSSPRKNGKRERSLSTSPASESLDSSPDKKKQKHQQGSDVSTSTFGQGKNGLFGRVARRLDEQFRGGSGFDSDQKTMPGYFPQRKI